MTIPTNGHKKRTPMEKASQGVILLGAVGGLFLGEGSPWGFVIGLSIQPFWFYTSITHHQWGVVAAAVIYTTAWSRGVYRNWDTILGQLMAALS